MAARQENVKWVDGMRGIASFLVVVTHLGRAFDPDLFSSTTAEGVSPRILQWPFIRILTQGRIGVAIFSLVAGFVCSLKPMRQARSGNHEGALKTVAKSAFRRIPRLAIPATVATFIVFVLCEFGAFKLAKRVPSDWLSYTAPAVSTGWMDMGSALFWHLISTWTDGQNRLDPNQWTLEPLLRGSMLIFVTLVGTMYMLPGRRMLVTSGLWFYYYLIGDSAFGMQFFAGMLLADIQVNFSDSSSSRNIHESKERSENDHFLDFPHRKSSERFGTVTALLGLLRPILSPLLIFIGLVFASYPEHNPEWVGWSRALHSFSTYIIPPNKDTCRYMTAFGVSFIALGIHFSPRARALLSNRLFLWLGKNSWAVYLLHGTLIRTVLVWMLYGMTMPADVAVTNDEGETHMEMGHLTMRGPFAQVILIPMWFCLVYICAEGWMRVVDPICSRWASAIEKFMVGEDGERNLGLLR